MVLPVHSAPAAAHAPAAGWGRGSTVAVSGLVIAVLLLVGTLELGIDIAGPRRGSAPKPDDNTGLKLELKLRPWAAAAAAAALGAGADNATAPLDGDGPGGDDDSGGAQLITPGPPPAADLHAVPSSHLSERGLAPQPPPHPPPRPPKPPVVSYVPQGFSDANHVPALAAPFPDYKGDLPPISPVELWFADGGDASSADATAWPTASSWRRWGTSLPPAPGSLTPAPAPDDLTPTGGAMPLSPDPYTGQPHLSHVYWSAERLGTAARVEAFNHSLNLIEPWKWQAAGVSARTDDTTIGRAYEEIEYLGYEVFGPGKRYESMQAYCEETGYNLGAPLEENRFVREIPGEGGATGLLAYQRVRVPRGLASRPPRYPTLALSEIHFVITSTTPHFFRNVAFQMGTWGRQVASLRVYSRDGHPSMGHPFYKLDHGDDKPPSRNHLRAVELTAEAYRAGHLPGVKWVFIADDDTYVFTDVLLEYLRHYNWREAIVMGEMGSYSGTVWFAAGGNGYVWSIPAILAIGEAHARGYCAYYQAVDMTLGACAHQMRVTHVSARGIWPGPGGGRGYKTVDDLAKSTEMPLIGLHRGDDDAESNGYQKVYDLWNWWALYGVCGMATGWEASATGRRPP